MAGTNVWRAARISARTSATTNAGRRSRRVRTRLWAMLNAPGLLQGGSTDSAAHVEDDYHRFAAGPRGY